MRSTFILIVASASLVEHCVSVRTPKVECVTMECKMKTIKVPRNSMMGDPSIYYGAYPNTQPVPVNSPAYHYYYGQAAASYPSYTNGYNYNAYASYNNQPSAYWATGYSYPYVPQQYTSPTESHQYTNPSQYCPNCSQRQSSQSNVASNSSDGATPA